ncbi:unnamed protein product [Caenorhabditis sp. 36 PRJEB53466]|nr:unnamed protein product [Caenorhabditis sp. 36 PRJEB53466]
MARGDQQGRNADGSGPGPSSSSGQNPEEPEEHRVGEPREPRNFRPTLGDRFFELTRKKISQKRNRFVYQGINLDLAYITDRIIAMGYPSEGVEACYRNTMQHTTEFLRRRHGVNHVKVFNLRGGCFYDTSNFQHNVITFDMTDHHPPRLELMAPFCREAYEWLEANEANVIAVHCKAGKGRTGVMICAFLIYIQYYRLPRQVLDYYSIVRTKNNKGVTIPSQRRYIYYYNVLREQQLNYFPLRMQLLGVYVEKPPLTSFFGSKIRIKVSNGSTDVFQPEDMSIYGHSWTEEYWSWRGRSRLNSRCDELNMETQVGVVSNRAYCFMVPPESPVFVEGDVRVDLIAPESGWFRRYEKIGHVWFNTMFACKGSCKVDFQYGDQEWPYKEGETSIAKEELGEHRKRIPEKVERTHPEGRKLSQEEEEEEENPDVEREWKDPVSKEEMGRLKLIKPPGLSEHATEDCVTKIYENYGMAPPRERICNSLHLAHKKNIVRDVYGERKSQEIDMPDIVLQGINREPRGVDGPIRIVYEKGTHVLTFPVYEMDRALKNKELDVGLRLHVVLKCISDSDVVQRSRSDVFCNTVFNAAETRIAQAAVGRPVPDPIPNATGAEKAMPPAVMYADQQGGYNGRAHPNLGTQEFDTNDLARQLRWCRFFYRQRDQSPSKYPHEVHTCALTQQSFNLRRRPGTDDDDVQPRRSARGGRSSEGGESPPDSAPSAPSASSARPDSSTDDSKLSHQLRGMTMNVTLAEEEDFRLSGDDDSDFDEQDEPYEVPRKVKGNFSLEEVKERMRGLATAQRKMDEQYLEKKSGELLRVDRQTEVYNDDDEESYPLSVGLFRSDLLEFDEKEHAEALDKLNELKQEMSAFNANVERVKVDEQVTDDGLDYLAEMLDTLEIDEEREHQEKLDRDRHLTSQKAVQLAVDSWAKSEESHLNNNKEPTGMSTFQNEEKRRLELLHSKSGTLRFVTGWHNKQPHQYTREETKFARSEDAQAIELKDYVKNKFPMSSKMMWTMKANHEKARKMYEKCKKLLAKSQ